MESKDSKPRSFWRVYRTPVLVFLPIVLVLLVGFGYWRWCLYLPVGSGPAGPGVPAAAFDHVWSDRHVVLLGVGDSVTAGFGASDGLSFFERLTINAADEFPDMAGICLSTVMPDLQTQNIAVSGSTSIDHRRHIESLPAFPSDVLGIVVMTTGGNDLIHDYGRSPPAEGAMYGATLGQAQPWIDNFRYRLDWMVTALAERFPGGCHIFIADIYDPTDGTGKFPTVGLWLAGMNVSAWPDGLAMHAAYNDIIADCAAEYDFVHIVKMRDEFMGHGFSCRKFWRSTYRREDPHYWYFGNVEDPNDRGYDAIRRLFLLAMINVFAAEPSEDAGPAP